MLKKIVSLDSKPTEQTLPEILERIREKKNIANQDLSSLAKELSSMTGQQRREAFAVESALLFLREGTPPDASPDLSIHSKRVLWEALEYLDKLPSIAVREIQKALSVLGFTKTVSIYDAQETYLVLEKLVNHQSPPIISNEQIDFLKTKGLIEVISKDEYRGIQNGIYKKNELTSKMRQLQQDISHEEKIITKLKASLNSKLHRFWTSKNTQKEESVNLTNAQKRRDISQSALANITDEFSRFKCESSDIEGFVEAGHIMMRITSKGHTQFEQLKSQSSRLFSLTLEAANNEMTQLTRSIEERINKFKTAWTYLTATKKFEKNSEVVDLALTLSMSNYTIDESYARMEIFINNIHKNPCTPYKLLKAAGSAAVQNGDIMKIVSETQQLVEIMHEDGHAKGGSEGYFTQFEATKIRCFPEGTLTEKYKRFEDIGKELEPLGWSRRTIETEVIQFILGKKSGTHGELTSKHSALEKALIVAGSTNCFQSGLAAAILIDLLGTYEDTAKQFKATLQTMKEMVKDLHNVRILEEDYPLAAVMMILPGNVKENFSMFLKTVEMLESAGWKDNVWSIALTIMTNGFQDILQSDFRPPYMTEHLLYSKVKQHYRSENSDFDYTSAITSGILAGDDFFLGFVFGGITGNPAIGLLLGCLPDQHDTASLAQRDIIDITSNIQSAPSDYSNYSYYDSDDAAADDDDDDSTDIWGGGDDLF